MKIRQGLKLLPKSTRKCFQDHRRLAGDPIGSGRRNRKGGVGRVCFCLYCKATRNNIEVKLGRREFLTRFGVSQVIKLAALPRLELFLQRGR